MAWLICAIPAYTTSYSYDGQTLTNDGTWSYTYFSIEYPIFNTIEEVKDKLGKLSDKLEEQKAEKTASETSQEEAVETDIPADSE